MQAKKEAQSSQLRVKESLVTFEQIGRMFTPMFLMDSSVSATWSSTKLGQLTRKAKSVSAGIQ